ncbi:hypothetical protein MIMGU_mgv1a008592mg [Erythranthe guttata]|uniref:F-box domain-containing protein n=1 Tax=Erythranthe guttata TaxID=4155 RepID=A0A022Q587_ERYGU|nr:hypothetical protein MIMGU_mgv1a008592mg [Erythranthe guttata]
MKPPKLTSEFFTHLPPETTIDILSRLPIRTIVRSKLVCKSWRDLLRTREFADSHLSRSTSGLAICEYSSELRIFEFEDEHNHQHRHNPVTGFPCRKFATIRLPTAIQGSANGLLFSRGITRQFDALHICNPITRECIQLPTPENYVNSPTIVANGFGVSKITGRYKVVRVSLEYDRDPYTYELVGITKSSCHVYTLGTGKWRSIVASVPPLGNNQYSIGAFLNGSLHCSFALPPLRESDVHSQIVVALGDYLCVCDNLSEDEVVVWLMKEYGDEKSWAKEIVIRKPQFLRGFGGFASNFVCPVRIFEHGHVLMSCYAVCLFCYSNETETAELAHMFGVFDGHRGMQVMLHRSSFLSLKCFPMENVTSF